MCNSRDGLCAARVGSWGADTGVGCVSGAVLAPLSGGRGGGARFSPASGTVPCWVMGLTGPSDGVLVASCLELSLSPLALSVSGLDFLVASRGSS